MIKTTTPNNNLENDEIYETFSRSLSNDNLSELVYLKEVEEKVKNIRFNPSKTSLKNITAYAFK